MIRNQWYAILEKNEVKNGRPLGVTRMGEKLVLWRDAQGQVVCMADMCPHLGAPLSLGKATGDCLACPFHGFEFDPSGQCVYLPGYGRSGVIPKALKAAIYPTHESHGFIWIWWGENPAQDLQPPQYFESIPDDFNHISFQQQWPVHYSRMVENQLDVAHLPFIHATTIGRGGRTVVDGPLVHLDENQNLLELWVYNRRDDGTPPRRAEQLPEPTRHPFLQFRFPNVWHNWISNDVRVTVAFVPVDDENCILYGRFYQRFMTFPGLREIANYFGKLSSIAIANQDRRVVSFQLPKKTSLRMGEKLMQFDRTILTYRQHRAHLKKLNGQEE